MGKGSLAPPLIVGAIDLVPLKPVNTITIEHNELQVGQRHAAKLYRSEDFAARPRLRWLAATALEI